MTWWQLLCDVIGKPVPSIVSGAVSEDKGVDWDWEEGNAVTL